MRFESNEGEAHRVKSALTGSTLSMLRQTRLRPSMPPTADIDGESRPATGAEHIPTGLYRDLWTEPPATNSCSRSRDASPLHCHPGKRRIGRKHPAQTRVALPSSGP